MTALFVELLQVRLGQFVWAGLYDDTTCQGWLVGLAEDSFAVKRYRADTGEYMGILAVDMDMVKYLSVDGDDLVRTRMEIEAKMKRDVESLEKTEFIVSSDIVQAITIAEEEVPVAKPKPKRKKKTDAKK